MFFKNTAAHCFSPNLKKACGIKGSKILPCEDAKLYILAGELDHCKVLKKYVPFGDNSKVLEKLIKAEEMHLHPDFELKDDPSYPSNIHSKNDIALVKVKNLLSGILNPDILVEYLKSLRGASLSARLKLICQ